MFVSTIYLLEALRRQLSALTLPAPRAAEAAFQIVRPCAHENLAGALRELVVYEDRVCLIVPTATRHANARAGRVLTSRRTAEFLLLIADRAYADADGSEAAFGGPDAPGAAALAELVIAALTGRSLGLPGVALEPGAGEPFRVGPGKDRALPAGRECWAQAFSTAAGEMRCDLTRRTAIPG